MMLRLELFPECGIVIELAVVTNPNRAVFVGHGLGTANDVDDRQPARPESSRAIAVKPIAVRPPVRERGRHTLHDSAISFQAGTVHESSDTAHLVQSSVLSGLLWEVQTRLQSLKGIARKSQGARVASSPSTLVFTR
jgi:hypothetical protein